MINIYYITMEVSWNGGTPKSSIWIGMFIINQPATALGSPWLWKPSYIHLSALYLISPIHISSPLFPYSKLWGPHWLEALWYPEAMPVAWLRCKGGDVEEQIGNIDITAYIMEMYIQNSWICIIIKGSAGNRTPAEPTTRLPFLVHQKLS